MTRAAALLVALASACSPGGTGGTGGGGSIGGGAGGGDPAAGGGTASDSGNPDAGSFDAGVPDAGPFSARIQDIQAGVVAHGAQAAVVSEFVTGVAANAGGSFNFYIQEASGRTTAGHTYPELAGMGVFVSTAEAALFPDVATVQLGDCVNVTGTVSEAPSSTNGDVGTTQLSGISAFSRASGCGNPPLPAGISFGNIATDTDSTTAGNQPGPKAETYEGVLVTISNVTTQAAVTSSRFNVSPDQQSATMEIDSLLIGTAFNYPAGTTFSSITGVYSQANRGAGNSLVVYRITPRNPADLSSP